MEQEDNQKLGLTSAEVRERVERGEVNKADISMGMSTKEIVRSNVFTYFNLIFLIIAVLLIVVGSYRNLTFLPIIVGNTLIGIIQGIRAKKTLDKMGWRGWLVVERSRDKDDVRNVKKNYGTNIEYLKKVFQ